MKLSDPLGANLQGNVLSNTTLNKASWNYQVWQNACYQDRGTLNPTSKQVANLSQWPNSALQDSGNQYYVFILYDLAQYSDCNQCFGGSGNAEQINYYTYAYNYL